MKLSLRRRVLGANHSPCHFRPLPRPLKCFPSTSAKCLLCRHFAALPSAAPILKRFFRQKYYKQPHLRHRRRTSVLPLSLSKNILKPLIYTSMERSPLFSRSDTSRPAGLNLVAYFQVKPGRGELELFLEATSPATPTPTSPPLRA